MKIPAEPILVEHSTNGSGERRVLLVDDQPITRKGLATVVNRIPNLQVCGEAGDAASALELVKELEPHAAVVDISLNGASGIEFVKNALAMRPRLLVLVMSTYDEQLFAPRAFRAGARGYIMKNEPSEKIVEALRRILDGRAYISPPLKDKLAERILVSRTQEVEDPVEQLSDREIEVFELIGDGLTTRQIAAHLNLSVKTIDSYREHLKTKLRVPDAPGLLQYAIQWTRTRLSA